MMALCFTRFCNFIDDYRLIRRESRQVQGNSRDLEKVMTPPRRLSLQSQVLAPNSVDISALVNTQGNNDVTTASFLVGTVSPAICSKPRGAGDCDAVLCRQ